MAAASLSLETVPDQGPCLEQLPEGSLGQHHTLWWGAWDPQGPALCSQDGGVWQKCWRYSEIRQVLDPGHQQLTGKETLAAHGAYKSLGSQPRALDARAAPGRGALPTAPSSSCPCGASGWMHTLTLERVLLWREPTSRLTTHMPPARPRAHPAPSARGAAGRERGLGCALAEGRAQASSGAVADLRGLPSVHASDSVTKGPRPLSRPFVLQGAMHGCAELRSQVQHGLDRGPKHTRSWPAGRAHHISQAHFRKSVPPYPNDMSCRPPGHAWASLCSFTCWPKAETPWGVCHTAGRGCAPVLCPSACSVCAGRGNSGLGAWQSTVVPGTSVIKHPPRRLHSKETTGLCV